MVPLIKDAKLSPEIVTLVGGDGVAPPSSRREPVVRLEAVVLYVKCGAISFMKRSICSLTCACGIWP